MNEESMRKAFKQMNRFMVFMWRLGLGNWLNAWPSVGGRIMVLMHIGRKSGNRYRTPVNYAMIDGDIYCTAGFGHISDWYRNLKANPHVEVWLPDGWWQGVAEDVSDSANRLLVMREVLIASGFAAYAANVNPRALSDEALAEATAIYRLVKIHRTKPCTGPNGPGEWAWVWPILTVLLLPLLFMKRRRSR